MIIGMHWNKPLCCIDSHGSDSIIHEVCGDCEMIVCDVVWIVIPCVHSKVMSVMIYSIVWRQWQNIVLYGIDSHVSESVLH